MATETELTDPDDLNGDPGDDGDSPVTFGDGLLLLARTLYVVPNEGRVTVFELDDAGTEGELVDIRHPPVSPA
ncbi:hypothetical protein [Georgenia sp. AZ-5]|uniref:hypothetical protein n=1 Tax=Georgenia sp. AZ-5 TaxID=3367526 RepID=UPI0037551824